MLSGFKVLNVEYGFWTDKQFVAAALVISKDSDSFKKLLALCVNKFGKPKSTEHGTVCAGSVYYWNLSKVRLYATKDDGCDTFVGIKTNDLLSKVRKMELGKEKKAREKLESDQKEAEKLFEEGIKQEEERQRAADKEAKEEEEIERILKGKKR
jgi:hypothetical protein